MFPGIKWIQHGVFLHKQFASIRVLFFSLTVVVLFNRLHRVYAVWVQISDFAFLTTSVRFSTNKLVYLAYKAYKAYKAFKAFMAFKRSRLNPVQNYRSVTSFSVDWPQTMRLVYASVSILSDCAIMLQVIVIQTRWNTKQPTTEFYKQKSRDPALSVHDSVNHHQDNTRDQHVKTLLDHI